MDAVVLSCAGVAEVATLGDPVRGRALARGHAAARSAEILARGTKGQKSKKETAAKSGW